MAVDDPFRPGDHVPTENDHENLRGNEGDRTRPGRHFETAAEETEDTDLPVQLDYDVEFHSDLVLLNKETDVVAVECWTNKTLVIEVASDARDYFAQVERKFRPATLVNGGREWGCVNQEDGQLSNLLAGQTCTLHARVCSQFRLPSPLSDWLRRGWCRRP